MLPRPKPPAGAHAPARAPRRRGPAPAAPRRREEPAAAVASSGPDHFGQYEILERIASGGMAELYKAKRTGVEGFQKIVAIKKILPHLADDEEFVTMFADEAKLAAQLNHPNIIHIYDLGKIQAGGYFIAMEYVDGRDLRAIQQGGGEMGVPLPVPLAVYVASKVAAALDYAHRRRDAEGHELNIVHRDVSPQNILISYEGDIKLCDFGIAKAASKASKTQSGALKGKIQYMSPEQAWGKPIDRRSDLFSLGVVLHELLTGERLFRGDTDINILEKVRVAEVAPPSRANPEVPQNLDAVVLKALAREPDDRYANASDLLRDLDSVLYSYTPAPGSADVAIYLHRLQAEEGAVADAKAREVAQAAHEAEPAARKRKSKGAPVSRKTGATPQPPEPAAPAPPAPPPPPPGRAAAAARAVAAGARGLRLAREVGRSGEGQPHAPRRRRRRRGAGAGRVPGLEVHEAAGRDAAVPVVNPTAAATARGRSDARGRGAGAHGRAAASIPRPSRPRCSASSRRGARSSRRRPSAGKKDAVRGPPPRPRRCAGAARAHGRADGPPTPVPVPTAVPTEPPPPPVEAPKPAAAPEKEPETRRGDLVGPGTGVVEPPLITPPRVVYPADCAPAARRGKGRRPRARGRERQGGRNAAAAGRVAGGRQRRGPGRGARREVPARHQERHPGQDVASLHRGSEALTSRIRSRDDLGGQRDMALSNDQKKFYENTLTVTKREITELEGEIQEELAKVKDRLAELQNGAEGGPADVRRGLPAPRRPQRARRGRIAGLIRVAGERAAGAPRSTGPFLVSWRSSGSCSAAASAPEPRRRRPRRRAASSRSLRT